MLLAILIIILSFCLFWFYRAFQIGISQNMALVTTWGGLPLQNPENYRLALAYVYLFSGLVMLSATFALIATDAPLNSWWFLGALAQVHVVARQVIDWRAKKNAPKPIKRDA